MTTEIFKFSFSHSNLKAEINAPDELKLQQPYALALALRP
jgi:hypothetical protein